MPETSPLSLLYRQEEQRVDEDTLVDELADSGFLKGYLEWASTATDAPRLFHVGSALAAIASCMGNRVHVWSWGKNIYPNIWLCLLAPSGFYRKSTCLDMTGDMIRQELPAQLMLDDFSREKLIAHLGERADRVLIAGEFGELLAKLSRDYMLGSKELLTSLFDGRPYGRQTMVTTAEIKTPAITIMTASTLDWIGDKVTEGDLRGGFLSRFLFLPAKKKNNWKGVGEGSDNRQREAMKKALVARTQITGQADISKVKPTFDKWLKNFETNVNEEPDARLMGFFSRAGTYILKLCMAFEACETECLRVPGKMQISEESLQKSIHLWEYLQGSIETVIGSQITTNRTQREHRDVLEAIGQGPTRHSDALRKSRMDSWQFKRAIETLQAREEITVSSERPTSGKAGRPVKVYRLRNNQMIDISTGPAPAPVPDSDNWRASAPRLGITLNGNGKGPELE